MLSSVTSLPDSCSVLVSGDGFGHADSGFGHAYAELRIKRRARDCLCTSCLWVRIGCQVGALVMDHARAYGLCHFHVYGRSTE